MSLFLILGGVIVLMGVVSTHHLGALAVPIVIVNGVVPILAGCIIVFNYIKKINTLEDGGSYDQDDDDYFVQ